MAELSNHRTFSHIHPANRHDASKLTLAAVMAAITAFFIASLASVFIYSNGSTLTQTAQAPSVYHLMETTGSGGVN